MFNLFEKKNNSMPNTNNSSSTQVTDTLIQSITCPITQQVMKNFL